MACVKNSAPPARQPFCRIRMWAGSDYLGDLRFLSQRRAGGAAWRRWRLAAASLSYLSPAFSRAAGDDNEPAYCSPADSGARAMTVARQRASLPGGGCISAARLAGGRASRRRRGATNRRRNSWFGYRRVNIFYSSGEAWTGRTAKSRRGSKTRTMADASRVRFIAPALSYFPLLTALRRAHIRKTILSSKRLIKTLGTSAAAWQHRA